MSVPFSVFRRSDSHLCITLPLVRPKSCRFTPGSPTGGSKHGSLKVYRGSKRSTGWGESRTCGWTPRCRHSEEGETEDDPNRFPWTRPHTSFSYLSPVLEIKDEGGGPVGPRPTRGGDSRTKDNPPGDETPSGVLRGQRTGVTTTVSERH